MYAASHPAPRSVRPFVEQAVRNNWALTKVISVFAVGVELFNIIRVIFYSPSGLTTPNNWTYFAFYASLFLAAAVFLCADALGEAGVWPLRSATAS